MRSASRIDLVTVDAFGTLLELVDPYERLGDALAARRVERGREAVVAAFAAEVAYYLPRSHEGRDAASLARLRAESAAVFLRELGVNVDPEEFAPTFVDALEFRPIPGAGRALAKLRAGGISLACVANWDVSLADQLNGVGLSHLFAAVVTSAEAGAAKPDPAVFHLALRRVGVDATRALHIGDEEADRRGALAAGLAFAPVPLATLPRRLRL
jgi:HAD superfamily hydrolase (TIGR01509 family)